ncbi:MAG: ATP-binding protein [Bacteroidota bacterium]|nr:ATP-binding protein [Bacteroidota bacterium]
MKSSPFIYGNTVSISSFTNREEEAKKLSNNLLGGINTMIISPRRWGKSSLVEKVISDINKKDKKCKTIIIDLFSVSSEHEFLELYAKEIIKASSSKWQEWVTSGKEFFKKIIPKINLGIDPTTDFSVSFDWKELKKHSDEILNLAETIAKKKGIKFIICLDEFQNLSSFNQFEIFEKKMRSIWQRQKLVTYCIYGSKRHMMNDIFNNPSKPFYRFGDIILLQKIKTIKWVNYITKSFANTKKNILPQDAELIPLYMKNHSWYVQQLAHYTWNLTQRKATIIEIEKALDELIQANTPLYQKEIENISITQLNLLKAVANGESKFMSTVIMQQYHLGTPRNVSKNKTILINNDIIHLVKDVYEFLDPAFELWFKKQFFQQSYKILDSGMVEEVIVKYKSLKKKS